MITNATKLNFQWKVIASIKNPAALLDNSLYFSLATNTGLNSQFSISHNLAYTPKLLLPTITYFQLLKNILADQRIRLDETKFPFTLSTDYFEKGTFNIRIRFFFPDVICLTVSLNQQTQLIKHPSPEDLIDYQSFKKLRSIAALVQATIGLANSLNHKDLPITNQFLIKPAIHLCDLTTPSDFDDYRKKHLRNAVGVLIRDISYQFMSSDIVRAVLEKNKQHNLKSSQELMLLDKQGILYLTPTANNQNVYSNRFRKCHDLFEIGSVFSILLDKFWFLRKSNEHFADFIIHKLRPWIQSPEIIFKKSVTNRHLWSLISGELSLNSQVNSILADKGIANGILDKRSYFDQFSDRWYEIKAFPEVLSRKIEEEKNIELSFVSDAGLRALIIDDYSEAKRTFAGKNYKSTIILCGSIAEALLTDSLNTNRPPGLTTTNLYNSDLATLIDLAINNGLITDSNLRELITPIRKYRNLIHPGVQIRKDLVPDESKAAIALEVIKLLVKELA